MTKMINQTVQDAPLLVVKNNSIRMMLVKTYAFGDSYAVCVGNKIAEVVMTPADYVLASSGNNRTLTVAAKSVAASNASAVGDHHIVHHNNVDTVLMVTDETLEAVNAAGDTVNFPSHVLTWPQPT